jgi:splicing factor 45
MVGEAGRQVRLGIFHKSCVSLRTARYHSPDREDDGQAPRGLGMPPSHQEDSSTHMQISNPITPMPDTGEEAYLRRLAMSQRPAQATQPPSALQGGPSFTPAQNTSLLAAAPPRFAPPASLFQDADAVPAEAGPSFRPESNAQTTSAPLTQAIIDERKKNAAAIAAKLAALSKRLPAPAAPTPSAENQDSQMEG